MAVKQSGKKKKALVIVLIVILSVLAAVVIAGGAVVNSYLNKINKIDNDNIDTIPPGSEEFDTDVPPDFWENSDILIITDSEPEQATTAENPAQTDPTQTGSDETSSPDEPVTAGNPEDTSSPAETGETTEPEQTTETPVTKITGPTMVTLPYENVVPGNIDWTPVGSLDDEKLLNILIVGQDNGIAGERTRTDSMMLFSINKSTGRMALISFLRDMYVQIPGGYQANRLNTPYKMGGFPLLYATLEENFGVHVDYGFVVDFTGFTNIIDTLGGVDIELTKNEAVYMTIGTEAGVYHMNGAVALDYARIRHLDSDFGRTNRQRNVIYACYKKIRGLGLSDLLSLLNTLLPMMATDMSNGEIISTVVDCYKFLGNEIYTYKIPAQDAFKYAYVKGMAVILPNFARNRVYLKYYLGLE